MARRRRTRLTVSLFPFLSVLACVIGTLVLVITATATSQVAAGGLDLERYEHLEQEIEAGRLRLAELRGMRDELETLAGRLEEARATARTLEREQEAAEQALSRNAPLREALRREEARALALEQELAPLVAAREAREQERATRGRERANARIRIEPAGSVYGLDPHFVECRPEGIVYYEGIARRPVSVATHHIARSDGYRSFLRAALYRSNATVIFLIREGGVDACQWARQAAAALRLRHGEIPLVGDGELDFSAMDGA